MIPLLKDQGLGLLVWSPLAGGFLSGKFTKDGTDSSGRRANFDFPPVDKERAYATVEIARGIAARRGASVAQVMLSWLLAQDAVTSIIIGVRSQAQLEDNLKSADLVLAPDELRALDDVSRLRLEYPAWMNVMPSDRLPGEERRFERLETRPAPAVR
jgi:aryl-alcohol dehydrogenase-like predicted oxidoreductase